MEADIRGVAESNEVKLDRVGSGGPDRGLARPTSPCSSSSSSTCSSPPRQHPSDQAIPEFLPHSSRWASSPSAADGGSASACAREKSLRCSSTRSCGCVRRNDGESR
jgi:hypothetical protein